ncbi:MAG: hypothetical protein K9G61_05830 [Bacteroidales bacterium]|nr:hypothetical protein [Bacteroidales bacterium]
MLKDHLIKKPPAATFLNPASRFMGLWLVAMLLGLFASAQTQPPAALQDLVNQKLEDAETSLEQMGYEIAGSSFFKREQLWYNEKQNVCISMAFEKKGDHMVTAIQPGDVAKCKEGIAAARKVTDSYHDGPAPANAAAIEKEREKLRAKGFVVSYWIQDIAPGRSTEYWKNEKTGACMHIVWNTADQSDVSSDSCDAHYATNPYLKE